MTLLLAIVIFLQILFYIIFLDVILSWLSLFIKNIRPGFVADIIDPLYSKVRNILPTTFWPIDITPIILILLIWFIKWLIYSFNPELVSQLPNFLR